MNQNDEIRVLLSKIELLESEQAPAPAKHNLLQPPEDLMDAETFFRMAPVV